MRAMIFAAGKGTRLSPLTDERPKPGVPFCNRPLMCEALDVLARAGITEVVANTHHLGGELPRLMEGHVPAGMELRFVHETKLLGTGGGLANARSLFGDEAVVVINGDIDFQPDLAAAIADHERSGALATMVLAPHPDPHRMGAVELDSAGRVRRLVGRPERDEELSAYMFTGVQVLSQDALSDMPKEGCIIRHAYRKWIDGDSLVRGFVSSADFSDLGTLPDYLEGHLRRWTETSVHESASVDSRAELTRCWVGAGARVGPVTLRDCVVWDGAEVDVSAERMVFSREHQVPVGSG
ncbi:MAG: mannose-1-phosphate guanylyltransferase [Polyangiales bacterium]|jgi:mannose-1-phosphate guanylyltransferase